MDFKKYLQTVPPKIDQEVQIVLERWRNDAQEINKELNPVLLQFIESCKGGKRLRGALVLLGYQLAGGEANDEIYKVSAGLEIFHAAILSHDDIIDQSPTRRGRPTLYKSLGGDHYGISQTICLGDMGLFLGVEILSEVNFDPIRKNKALSVFSKMVINTGLGEMLDVELPRLPDHKTEEAVITIHRLKTSYYTIIYPLIIGGILGGADENLLKSFEKFGNDLGIAFQIHDDILGVFGDEKTLGKSVTSDIEEGKNTLLYTEATKNAKDSEKEILEKYYGKGKIGEEELEKIRQVFIDTGSLEYSKEKALEYVTSAKKVIPDLTQNSEYKALLNELSDFLIERQS